MHCDWLKKVTGHEAMCQGLRETACKSTSQVSRVRQVLHQPARHRVPREMRGQTGLFYPE